MKPIVPAGARWYKFEFHCHTPASSDYGAGSNQASLKETSPEEWLLAYMAAGIDCVAVTDHNTGAWIDRLKTAYAEMVQSTPAGFRPLTVFPAVEVTASGGEKGIHILVVFPLEQTTSGIDQFIGSLGYSETITEHNNAQVISRKGALDVCKLADDAGAIAIPAHVDDVCGLFQVLQNGQGIQDFLGHAPVFAIEVLDESSTKPTPYTDRHLAWAEVLGSDAHHLTGSTGQNFPGSRFTWVKMGPTPCLEGLRLALHDGNPLSIRRSDEGQPSATSESAPILRAPAPPFNPNNEIANHRIEDLRVSNAQFIGRPAVEVSFSPWLNSIVGGRGSGKSTLVELARLVLRRDRELKDTGDPEKNFKAFAQVYDKRKELRGESPGALSRDTEIEMTYRIGPDRYKLRWREDGTGEPLIEEKADGGWEPALGEIASRFPVRIFSQKQVYSLAQDSRGLLTFIDESPDVNFGDWQSRWQQEEARFFQLQAQARQIEASISDRDRIVGLLEDVKKKLAVFESAGHADVLKHYQRCRRQNQRMSQVIEGIQPLPENILRVVDDIELPSLGEDVFEGATGLDEVLTEYDKLLPAIERARSELIRISEELKKVTDGFSEAVWKTSWGRAIKEAETKFEELKRQLAEVGTDDPNEYGRLVQQRQVHETSLAKIESEKKHLEEVRQQASQSLEKLQVLRRELSKKRADFLSQALAGNRFVRMTVVPYGEDATVEQRFRELIGREGTTFARDISQDDGEAKSGLLPALYGDYLDQKEPDSSSFEGRLSQLKKLLRKAGVTGSWDAVTKPFVNHLGSMKPEQFDRLDTWWPEDSLRIEYSDGKSNSGWKSIRQGSPGQQTAAMLAFLLSYGDQPMILDQPEDDLDNHLIYDLIVRQIRENKTKRQIIVVTHNPNIVVNGDAELVVVMDFKAGQCRVSQSGCLQEREVREEICNVMEGGREAFKQRYRRVILENE
ncbi:MAG: hypothetical protein PWP23_3144 [Candidatus Sumerlaeota bacterium]|nr:hypothetical protein [Candidatus Sumerlaeota bacterium]